MSQQDKQVILKQLQQVSELMYSVHETIQDMPAGRVTLKMAAQLQKADELLQTALANNYWR